MERQIDACLNVSVPLSQVNKFLKIVKQNEKLLYPDFLLQRQPSLLLPLTIVAKLPEELAYFYSCLLLRLLLTLQSTADGLLTPHAPRPQLVLGEVISVLHPLHPKGSFRPYQQHFTLPALCP